MSEPSSKRRGLPIRVKMRHEPHFVEELGGREEPGVGRLLRLSAIEPDPEQPRGALGDLTDLVTSIRDKGVLEPILVRPLEEGAGPARYRIISGERRYRAAVEAGLYEVPVIEMAVDEDEALEIALIENLQRKDLTPFEEAEGYRSLGERFGYTHEAIARVVGRSRSVVTESLALLGAPRRVRQAAEALGITSKSVLREVLKAGSEEKMLELLERVARQGLSRDDLRHSASSGKKRRGAGGPRRKPFTFRFRDPERTFSLSLSFRRSEVERSDLIEALERILEELRKAEKGSG